MRLFSCVFPVVVCHLWMALTPLTAQPDTAVYAGRRIAVFDLEVLQIRDKTVMARCRMANTGRIEVGSKKNEQLPIVELDTLNLPAILWGHEKDVAVAAARHFPQLKPGEISPPIWFNITVRAPDPVPVSTPTGCPDLVIDTLYLFRQMANEWVIRYTIRNAGTASVEIAGKTAPLGINWYFISGTRLTRGAIPAGNTLIQTGRETLTGWLKPGQKIQCSDTVNLKNRTKFAPNILVELAPPGNLIECDRTNNTRSFEWKY